MSNIERPLYAQDMLLRQEAIHKQRPIMAEITELAHQPGFEVYDNIREVDVRTGKEGRRLTEFTEKIIEDIESHIGGEYTIFVGGQSGVGKSETAAAIIEQIAQNSYLKKVHKHVGARMVVWNMSYGAGIKRAIEAADIPFVPFDQLTYDDHDAASRWMVRGSIWTQSEKPTSRPITSVTVVDAPWHVHPIPGNRSKKIGIPHPINFGGTLARWKAKDPQARFILLPRKANVTDTAERIREAVNLSASNQTGLDYREIMRNFRMKYDIPTPPAAELARKSANPEAMRLARRRFYENLASLDPTDLASGPFTADDLEADPELAFYVESNYMHWLMKLWEVPEDRYMVGVNSHLTQDHIHMLNVLEAHRLPMEIVMAPHKFDYNRSIREQAEQVQLRAKIRTEQKKQIQKG